MSLAASNNVLLCEQSFLSKLGKQIELRARKQNHRFIITTVELSSNSANSRSKFGFEMDLPNQIFRKRKLDLRLLYLLTNLGMMV